MEINEYLIKSFELMRSLENVDFFAGVSNLSRTEFHLLREVILEAEKGKNIISSELARRLGITRSAVSQIVTKMEQRGIVNRVSSPTDRKIAYICLSESSMAVLICRRHQLIRTLPTETVTTAWRGQYMEYTRTDLVLTEWRHLLQRHPDHLIPSI